MYVHRRQGGHRQVHITGSNKHGSFSAHQNDCFGQRALLSYGIIDSGKNFPATSVCLHYREYKL